MSIFKLPDLGEGLPDAEIHEWYVKEGDVVKLDQPVVSMETAKAVVDVPAPQAGKIVKLYGKPGDIIKTGEPLMEFEAAVSSERKDAGTVVGAIETSDRVIDEPAAGLDIAVATKSTIKAMPAVRALATKLGIELASIAGTGAGGAITLEDVKRAGETTSTSHTGGETFTGARRAMAFAMSKAHAEVVPASYSETADIHRWAENTDTTSRIIRAIAAACQAEPALNAHFDGKTLSRKLFNEVNLAIAVDTPAGLYTPVIKDVAGLSTDALRTAINELKEKAKTNSFSPQDLQNSTITLSNFGTIGCYFATPVVVPPMVAIIAIGKARIAVVADNGKPAVHKILPISLTFDHRAVTGGEAARFMAALVTDLEKV